MPSSEESRRQDILESTAARDSYVSTAHLRTWWATPIALHAPAVWAQLRVLGCAMVWQWPGSTSVPNVSSSWGIPLPKPLPRAAHLVDKCSPMFQPLMTALGSETSLKGSPVCLALMPTTWCCYVHLFLPLSSQLGGQFLDCREPSLYFKILSALPRRGDL